MRFQDASKIRATALVMSFVFLSVAGATPLAERKSQVLSLAGMETLIVSVGLVPFKEFPDREALEAEVRTKLRTAGIPVGGGEVDANSPSRNLLRTGFLHIAVECDDPAQCYAFTVTLEVEQIVCLCQKQQAWRYLRRLTNSPTVVLWLVGVS